VAEEEEEEEKKKRKFVVTEFKMQISIALSMD
jgi:hypothetical protein